MEIDSDNNLKRFKTGSGAEETVEIHDFQIVSESLFSRPEVVGLSVCLAKWQSCNCKHGISVIWFRESPEYASMEEKSAI